MRRPILPGGMLASLRRAGGLTLAAACSVAAQAHDSWLMPEPFAIAAPGSVALRLTSGERFAVAETSIKPARLGAAACRQGGTDVTVSVDAAEPHSLRLRATLPSPGLWTCWVELQAQPIELEPASVREYLDEIGAGPALRATWADLRRVNGGRWREIYHKQAKTLVQVGPAMARGSGPTDDSPALGLAFEIAPEGDLNSLRAGDRLVVRVLKHGAPVSGLPVGLSHEGSRGGRPIATGSDGRVAFALPRPGRYLLRTTELRPTAQAGVDWESDFATLTLQVGTARALR